MINIAGVIIGCFVVAGGVASVVILWQGGRSAAASQWLLILAGILLITAFVHGVRFRKGPELRLMLASMLVLCVAALLSYVHAG